METKENITETITKKLRNANILNKCIDEIFNKLKEDINTLNSYEFFNKHFELIENESENENSIDYKGEFKLKYYCYNQICKHCAKNIEILEMLRK